MKSIFSLIFCLCVLNIYAQNRNIKTGVGLGVGNSGFMMTEQGDDDIERISYPVVGLSFQKRISSQWALHFFPNLGLSGNKRILNNPVGNITSVESRSGLVNLAIHGKYFLGTNAYLSFGPEISYLAWNRGSTYNGDRKIFSASEIHLFNRTSFSASTAIGYSIKVAQSRKNAPIEIDVFWFFELRYKQGISNILVEEHFGDLSSRISSLELVSGVSFGSKK